MKIIVRVLISALSAYFVFSAANHFVGSFQSNKVIDGITIAKPDFTKKYSREYFGKTWDDTNRDGCDTRQDILKRDLTQVSVRGCKVTSGVLKDKYTGSTVKFSYTDPMAVQVDHIVPLAVAWYSGANSWSFKKRLKFANDPANLVAVSGVENENKGAATPDKWLPATHTCWYLSKYVAVVRKYDLSVTANTAGVLAKKLYGACK